MDRRWWWVTPEVVALFNFTKDVALFVAGLTLFILETQRQEMRELAVIAEFGLMGLPWALASDRRTRRRREEKDDDA